MTVWRYGPSKHGLTVDAVNDGAVPLFRNLGTVMMVHDGTVDGRSNDRNKAQKWHFDPKMADLALFSSFLNVACVLFVQTCDRCDN